MIEIVLLTLLALVILISGPLAGIWALNTLFGLGIEYTPWTWLAALIVMATVTPTGSGRRGSE